MNGSAQAWTYVASHDIIGPGYAASGVEIFRGPRRTLKWARAGSEDPKLHPAYLRIEPDKQNAFLILYNPETRQEAVIAMKLQSPLKVRDDSIDSRVGAES